MNPSVPPARPIVLVGYRCSGKSTVGRRLAELWRLPFFDTDEAVERRAGMGIHQIFKTQGEAGFRRLESAVLRDIDSTVPCVIATGGGIVATPHNHKRLRELGAVVFLHASPEVIRRRMLRREREDGPAPSLSGRNWKDEIEDMLAIRTPLYRAVMHVEPNANADPEHMAALITAAVATL